NMAQIGATLDGHPADPLVIVAMTLLFIGFMTKAAAIPVHFWLADAHAVAPTPVCVLFSGVMVELGAYAIARLYWTIFAGPMAPLFMLAGVLLHRFGTIDEFDLHGAGRALPVVGVLFAIGGLLLAAVPVVTSFFGKSLLDAAATEGHYAWLPAVFVFSSIFT